ncbi:MAG: ferrous iron transport protein A [Rhodosalinus sp.]|uniref:FeoA family protein n=1 Tax=Rhodosalinus sp. TaxID=2047741 RepID=UPI003978F24E
MSGSFGSGGGWRWRRGRGEDCQSERARTLDDAEPGDRCVILRLRGRGVTRQRLLDLGFQPGREVTVLRNAPLRDPIETQVGESFVALRRDEAAHVFVEVRHD